MPNTGNQRGVKNGDNQERDRVGKDWKAEMRARSGKFRDKNVQMKKFIQETGRSKMEEEHIVKLTVRFPNQSNADGIRDVSLTWI